MNRTIRAGAKKLLSKALPNSSRLRYLSYLPLMDEWKQRHGKSYPTFRDRYSLYDYLNQEYLNNAPMSYLEFGVFQGASIRYWSEIHHHSDSELVGFDTFTGLPEQWENFVGSVPKTTFSVQGALPDIDDRRVSFVKGLFQETVDSFLKAFAPKPQLVIHNDSDLYSATMYVLTRCHDVIVPGTIIIFDEFSSVLHEFRALEDYCSSYNRQYAVIAATRLNYAQVAIQVQ